MLHSAGENTRDIGSPQITARSWMREGTLDQNSCREPGHSLETWETWVESLCCESKRSKTDSCPLASAQAMEDGGRDVSHARLQPLLVLFLYRVKITLHIFKVSMIQFGSRSQPRGLYPSAHCRAVHGGIQPLSRPRPLFSQAPGCTPNLPHTRTACRLLPTAGRVHAEMERAPTQPSGLL